MTDFHQECHECGCKEIWDADCEECNGRQQTGDGSDCLECDGTGYQEGISECSECGIQDATHAFETPTHKETTT